ncbi:MAG: sigma-54-dependent Fis family transcriptional regulator [Nitrospira sp.]|nr:sigma-54-dependent Fis family transcriptional regulator [Nitrospira sp.]
MAGSPDEPIAPPFSDPILMARLEAIQQIAGGLTERVAVMDRHFNVIYANESAWSSAAVRNSDGRRAKCYEAFAHQANPCGTCPAMKVFESPEVQSMACSVDGDGTACGMRQASPLVLSQGDVGSMLVLFKDEQLQPVSKENLVEVEHQPPAVRESLGELIGRSPAMQQLFDMVALVAESSATVLIQGESGTGKELLAKTIHALSGRKDKPFIVVDCGALPETLLESELFGHVKGAFTGAVANKQGLFQEANGGTIFLDEIADTAPVFQAKLLRVLQEGEIKPVGGTKTITVDVRIISATNQDLTELVNAGSFRRDLYYRLAVLPLYLPPLRDRREDIPLLAEQFIARSCTRHHQALRQLSGQAMRALSQAPWPGNVRELQHYIERAVVTTTGPTIACEDLIASRHMAEETDLRSATRDAVAQAERTRIVEALKMTGGNRARAAKLLKISRAGLYNKLRAYRIE